MRNFLITLLFVTPFALTSILNAQNAEVDALLGAIEGAYKIDNNNDVYMQEVIELDSSLIKNQLYIFAKEYIANSYGNANAVLQVDDKEQGLIICKGLYTDISCTEISIGSAGKYTATHILKFQIKDGRIRVTLTVTNINEYYAPSYSAGYYDQGRSTDRKMTDYYPINKGSRPVMGKKLKAREGYVFYKVVGRMQNTIKSIKTQFTNPQNFNYSKEDDNW